MNHLKKRILVNLGIEFFLGFLGLVLWQFPGDPDASFSLGRMLGVGLIFSFFCFNLFHWGQLTSRALKLSCFEPLSAWAIGTLEAVLLFALLGHLNQIGAGKDFLAISILAFGPILNSALSENSNFSFDSHKNPIFAFGLVAISSIILMKLIIATFAHGHSDPLFYHLYAPREWWNTGSIQLTHLMPISMTASYWEYFLGWGNIFFAEKPNHGLIEAQIFAQFAHVFFGMGGCLLALYSIATTLKLPKHISIIFAIIGISSSELWPLPWLAKNDFAAAFWSLTAIAFFIDVQEISLRKRSVLVGTFAGLAIATKWNNAFLLVPLFLIFYALLYLEKSNTKDQKKQVIAGAFFLGITVLIAVSPIMIRNLVLLKNPFYPLFPNLFSSAHLTPIHLQEAEIMAGQLLPIADWPKRVLSCFYDNYFSFFVLLTPIFFFWKKLNHKNLLVLSFSCISSYIIFNTRNYQTGFLRWLGPPLILLPAMGFAIFWQFLAQFKNKKIELIGCTLFTVLLILFHYNRNANQLRLALSAIPANAIIRNDSFHLGGSSKAWLRMNVKNDDLIVSTGENQVYYLIGYNYRIINEDIELTHLTHNIETSAELVASLKKIGAHYLLDSLHWTNSLWSRESLLIDSLIQKKPNSIVHQGKNSRIIDVTKL